MGSLIKAVCENCGYETELTLGGGMRDFESNCSFPALNKTMNRIEERNIFKREKEKNNPSHILFYDSKSLVDKKSIRSKDHLQWDKYKTTPIIIARNVENLLCSFLVLDALIRLVIRFTKAKYTSARYIQIFYL